MGPRLAFETILFGRTILDLDRVLARIAAAGFEGVEFSQPPDRIQWRRTPDSPPEPIPPKEFASLLHVHGLEFLGISGGSIAARLAFCDQAGLIPPYLYVDDLNMVDDSVLELAAQRGTRVAFHPHAFLAIDKSGPLEAMREPRLKNVAWLPDTAHLTIMGGGFSELERQLRDDPARIVAIHWKDWDPAYGRSYHRYAKGFVSLGRGVVPLERIAKAVAASAWDGWLVVEQDYSRTTPERTLRDAVRWLERHGFPVQRNPEPVGRLVVEPPPVLPANSRSDRLGALAGALAVASTERLPECYATLATALRDYFDSPRVALWAYRPGRDMVELFSLLAVDDSGDGETDGLRLAEGTDLLTCVIERRAFESAPSPDSSDRILCVPVLNRFNHHHIRFVAEVSLPADAAPVDSEESAGLSDLLAEAADGALDDACAYAAGKVQIIAARQQNLAVLDDLRRLVQEHIDCEAVTIFLANPADDRLDPWSTTGLVWNERLEPHRRCYGAHSDPSSPTARVWRRREILLMVNGQETPHQTTSWESGVDPGRDNILIAPLVSVTVGDDGEERAKSIGVIRCRNKRPLPSPTQSGPRGPKVRTFNHDDAAVLDSICQAAVPHIRLLVADQRRRKAVADMSHELSKPVNALRAAVDKLRSDLGRIDKELLVLVDDLGSEISPVGRRRLREFASSGHRKYFRQDYVKNILSWTRLMVRVIGNADVYGLRSVVPELETEPAFLMAEVVAPAVDMAEHLLKRRGFDKSHIRYDSFADIPRLHVDINLFQQVFFNLLSNAIKYAYNDPARFGIEISTRVQGDRFCIAVRDWGPGIESNHEKSIFEEGVRGPEHLSDLVGGLGLGLWVVREVVRQHGGSVAVTNNGDPTEITLFLPRSLASAPPRQRNHKTNRDGA